MFKKMTRRAFIKKSVAFSASSLFGMSILSRCTRNTQQYVDITVVTGGDYFQNTMEAVENLGGMGRFVQRGSRVAILANPQRNNPGAYTKPEIVRAAIKMCKKAGAKDVNCLSWQPEQNWENTGTKTVVDEEEANLIILNWKMKLFLNPSRFPRGLP